MKPAAMIANAARDGLRGQPGRGDERQQCPHGVKLPHVAEVAERRRAHLPVAPDHGERARLDARGARKVGAVGNQQVQADSAARGDRRDRQHHALPRPLGAERSQPVRQRGADHQRADQQPERSTQAARVPRGGDLHPDRIDAGEKEAGREMQREQNRILVRERDAQPVGKRAGQRAQQEHEPRREAVRDRQQREHQRAADETEPDRRGQRAERARRERHRPLQVGQHRVDREPQRCAGELCDDDRRQHAARNGRVGGRGRHGRAL